MERELLIHCYAETCGRLGAANNEPHDDSGYQMGESSLNEAGGKGEESFSAYPEMGYAIWSSRATAR